MKSNVLLVVLMLVLAASGLAQEKGNIGLLFKTGGINSVGASYELSDTMTLRASLGLSASSSETEIQYLFLEKNSHDMNEYNVSLGLFFDLVKKKDLTLYSGVEVGYAYSNYEYKISPQYAAAGIILYPESQGKDKANGYTGNILLGVHHKIGKKFAVFGEIGFGVLKRKTKELSMENVLKITDETTQWNLKRSGIGVVFYL